MLAQLASVSRWPRLLKGPNVWASVLRLTHAVVAQAAVRGARRPEHLAGEAVLELHHLLVDEDLLGSGRRAVRGGS